MDKKLEEGYKAFLEKYFEAHQDLFSDLAKQQNPDTMVITCSDSRINPALMLDAKPGELFITRNIGNVVPPYLPSKGSTQAAIEYAVNALNISKIVVIGHSNCGACAHMYHKYKEEEAPLEHVEGWLTYLKDAKYAALLEVYKNPDVNIFEATEKNNIVSSVRRLMSYPYIQDRIIENKIDIEGWWYNIGNGKVEVYNPATNKFELVVV